MSCIILEEKHILHLLIAPTSITQTTEIFVKNNKFKQTFHFDLVKSFINSEKQLHSLL